MLTSNGDAGNGKHRAQGTTRTRRQWPESNPLVMLVFCGGVAYGAVVGFLLAWTV